MSTLRLSALCLLALVCWGAVPVTVSVAQAQTAPLAQWGADDGGVDSRIIVHGGRHAGRWASELFSSPTVRRAIGVLIVALGVGALTIGGSLLDSLFGNSKKNN